MLRESKLLVPQEEGGVFGIYAPAQEIARLTYYGLYALQHRGQESAGIAVAGSQSIVEHKGRGLVSEVFSDAIIDCLKGKRAIGYIGNLEMSLSLNVKVQPLVVHYHKGMMALAQNGTLSNVLELREKLGKKGAVFQTSISSEVIINLITHYSQDSLEEALAKTMQVLRGAYASVILAEDKLLGFRDPWGIRPLCIGRLADGYCLASESCALNTIGAKLLRDVEPGEIVVIDQAGLHSRHKWTEAGRKSCVFEYIHIARPDSTIDRLSVLESRQRIGMELAREYPVDADLVVAVPDSGTAPALGYASALGIPFGEGVIRNRYVQPRLQSVHKVPELAIRLKYNVNPSVLKDKRVVLVDDSLIQGTTSSKLVTMLRKAGAKEVHFLVASLPVAASCRYGIARLKRESFLAAKLDCEEICALIGADSLHYISEEGLLEALGTNSLCLECFKRVDSRKLKGGVLNSGNKSAERRKQDGIGIC